MLIDKNYQIMERQKHAEWRQRENCTKKQDWTCETVYIVLRLLTCKLRARREIGMSSDSNHVLVFKVSVL